MKTNGPKTLLEAIRYFSDEDVCVRTLAIDRWPDGVIPCPDCGCTQHYYLKPRRRWKCKACGRQFSIKVGTVMEDSPISLTKWLPAIWMITNAKNGISSYEIHRALGITQKSAWFLLHRIRLAMRQGTFERLGDDVEVDETFIGGLARNMHRDVRERKITGTGASGKQIVLGFLERGGDVRTFVIGERDKYTLESIASKAIIPGSRVYTDAWGGYNDFGHEFRHQVVDHAVQYVDGFVHTNGLENFWSLLSRGLRGTYVAVRPFHLFRYLDEQVFRFNERRDDDAGRFAKVVGQITGKRVTYKQLTGKEQGLQA